MTILIYSIIIATEFILCGYNPIGKKGCVVTAWPFYDTVGYHLNSSRR